MINQFLHWGRQRQISKRNHTLSWFVCIYNSFVFLHCWRQMGLVLVWKCGFLSRFPGERTAFVCCWGDLGRGGGAPASSWVIIWGSINCKDGCTSWLAGRFDRPKILSKKHQSTTFSPRRLIFHFCTHCLLFLCLVCQLVAFLPLHYLREAPFWKVVRSKGHCPFFLEGGGA